MIVGVFSLKGLCTLIAVDVLVGALKVMFLLISPDKLLLTLLAFNFLILTKTHMFLPILQRKDLLTLYALYQKLRTDLSMVRTIFD